MTKLNGLFFVVISCFLTGNLAQADPIAVPNDLTDTLNKSTVVVIARIVKHIPSRWFPDKKTAANLNEKTGGIIWTLAEGTGALIPSTKPIDMGMYSFKVLDTLKGECGPEITLPLAQISTFEYGYVITRVGEGDNVLLFLQRGQNKQLEPTDPTVPLVWLERDLPLMHDNGNIPVQTYVVNQIASSLGNPLYRRANAYLLRTIIDPFLPAKLDPYAQDVNLYTRANVLYGLAVNQQLDAINKIVTLTKEMVADGSGTGYAVEALAHYTTRKALPYLNPLLFDHDPYIRLNASESIRRLADKSSIPYLIVALRDPEKQEVVAYNAYATLHKLIPALGKPVSLNSFYSEPEKYSKPIIKWWQAELNGEHTKVNDKMPVFAIPQDTKQKLSYLQSMLFVSSITTRKKAITLLDTLSDRNSIPYLLLALSDPDAEVSYQAYVILHKLIPISGPTMSKTNFSLQKDAVLVLLDKWWRQELSVENAGISSKSIQ